MGQLIESSYSMFFNDDIKDKKGVLLLSTKMMNRSFNVDWKEVCLSANTCEDNESILWHKQLGHFNYATLKRMVDLHMTYGLQDIQEQKNICEACQLEKQTRVVFPDNAFRALSKLQLIHTDVCGPMHNESLNGSKYFLLFIDDYSRFCWVYFLKSKTDGKAYRSLVGSLLNLTATRPDILFVVNYLSRFMQDPSQIHFVKSSSVNLVCFSDNTGVEVMKE